MGSLGLAIRMVISLAVVLCLLFVLARFARRGRPRGDGPQMSVISRVNVGAKASVAVVQLGDQALVVGVTEQSVTLLSEGPVGTFVPEASEPEPVMPSLGEDVTVRRVVVDKTEPTAKPSKLAGSALAPDTWKRTVDAVRDLTVRR